MAQHRFARARRAFVYVALAALFGVLSLTLAQCTMVGDNLTGVQMSAGGGPTTCTGQCRIAYHNALSAARKNHQAILSQCTDQACKDAENARWDAQQAQLKANYDTCVANCHKQGAGFGG